MTTFTNGDGLSIELDAGTVDDLKALARIVRLPEAEVAAAAIEAHRVAQFRQPKQPKPPTTTGRRSSSSSS